MEIVNAALKKHKQIIDSLSKQGELTLNPYDDLDEYQKEVVEYACNLLEMRILSKKELLKRVPDNPFIKREIQEVEYNLYKLRHGDIELIEEYTEVYEKDKQRKLDDMISHIESAIESCQEVKKNPEWYKPGNKTIEEFNSLCEINLKQLNENLLRLKAGDYELCKELEHDQREA